MNPSSAETRTWSSGQTRGRPAQRWNVAQKKVSVVGCTQKIDVTAITRRGNEGRGRVGRKMAAKDAQHRRRPRSELRSRDEAAQRLPGLR